jgi:SHS2 domain-containing protein
MGYKFLEHTADVKFQAFGNSLEQIFEQAFLALKETITKNEKIQCKIKKAIKIKGDDLENLLYKFLEEILFLLDSENFISSEVTKIEIIKHKDKFELKAKILGDLANNCKLNNDVKAITYNNMFVKQEKRKWICQVVLDV